MKNLHKQDHASNAKDAAEVVDLAEDLPTRHTSAIDTGRWEVEDGYEDKTDEIPDSAKQTNPPPCRIIGDELTPKNRRAERQDGEDEHGHIFAAFGCWCKLRSDRQSSQLVDTGTDSGEDHPSNKDVHLVRCGADDHPDTDEYGSDDGNPSTSDQI